MITNSLSFILSPSLVTSLHSNPCRKEYLILPLKKNYVFLDGQQRQMPEAKIWVQGFQLGATILFHHVCLVLSFSDDHNLFWGWVERTDDAHIRAYIPHRDTYTYVYIYTYIYIYIYIYMYIYI